MERRPRLPHTLRRIPPFLGQMQELRPHPFLFQQCRITPGPLGQRPHPATYAATVRGRSPLSWTAPQSGLPKRTPTELTSMFCHKVPIPPPPPAPPASPPRPTWPGRRVRGEAGERNEFVQPCAAAPLRVVRRVVKCPPGLVSWCSVRCRSRGAQRRRARSGGIPDAATEARAGLSRPPEFSYSKLFVSPPSGRCSAAVSLRAANGGIASWWQSARLVTAVVERGSLGESRLC